MALSNGARPRARLTSSVTTVSVALVVLLVGVEIIVRLLDGVGFTARNFVAARASVTASELPGAYEPALGYQPMPGHDSTPPAWNVRVTIGPDSLRQNASGEPTPVPVAVVAAGGSYTFGDQVSDRHTWPAQLQGLLGQPVANGGVFGYGLDQAVLRAERLVAAHRPLALVLAFAYDDVRGVEMLQRAGREKPYFDVADGRLVPRNVPPSPNRPRIEQLGMLRAVLGYSYLIDWTVRRAGATGWWYAPGFSGVRAHADGPQVACLLMQRLRGLQDSTGATVLVVAQYAPSNLIAPDDPRSVEEITGSARLLDCATKAGLTALDTLPALQARYRVEPAAFVGRYYLQSVPSAAGHRMVAELVADGLARAHGGG